MPAGPTNPLGARALYIFQDGKDTLFRLHGSPEWNSIGNSVSSGCVRLINQDIIDLYDRVPEASPIVVIRQGTSAGCVIRRHRPSGGRGFENIWPALSGEFEQLNGIFISDRFAWISCRAPIFSAI